MKLQIVLCFLDYNFVLTENKPIIDPAAILMLKRQQLRYSLTNELRQQDEYSHN